ncbi:MAG: glycine zipper 2TM domain-containing protein [Polaromonas sp.]|nr:glycine zipper 2TM domain-containing protein [Polaromonas sp.]
METNPNQPVGVPGVANHPDFSQKLQHNKTLVAIVAVLGVTVLALAAALVVKPSGAQPGGTMAPLTSSATTEMVVPAPVPVAVAQPQPAARSNLAPATTRAPAAAPPLTYNNGTVVAQNNTETRPRADVCASCGRVESVTPVQRQGQVNGVAVGNQTIGLGTVAGGVVGGLLGNQMGSGKGNTAMTVIGAAGGAFAGNAIEKNMKKVTVYQVRVRMDDGTSRTMDVSSNIAVGSRVVVEGKNLRLA